MEAEPVNCEHCDEKAWPVPVRLLWRRFMSYARKSRVCPKDHIEVYISDAFIRRWPQLASARTLNFELGKMGRVTWHLSSR